MNSIGNEGMKFIFKSLKSCINSSRLKNLNLSNNAFGDEGFFALADFFNSTTKSCNCELKSLNVAGNNKLTREGFAKFSQSLKNNNSLTTLSIGMYEFFFCV